MTIQTSLALRDNGRTTLLKLLRARTTHHRPKHFFARTRGCRVVSCVFTLLIAIHALALPASSEPETSEYKLKVAYLYNFLGLIEPSPLLKPSDAEHFSLCVIGGPDLRAQFAVLDNEPLQAKKIRITHVDPQGTLPPCDTIFASASAGGSSEKLLQSLKGRGVLTIGESDHFCAQGGIINFFFEERKLRFEINLTRAREEQIRISAKLLKHARTIE